MGKKMDEYHRQLVFVLLRAERGIEDSNSPSLISPRLWLNRYHADRGAWDSVGLLALDAGFRVGKYCLSCRVDSHPRILADQSITTTISDFDIQDRGEFFHSSLLTSYRDWIFDLIGYFIHLLMSDIFARSFINDI